MKKAFVLISVMLIIIVFLVLLSGCVEKTEYDNKEIVLIHYYTTESFIPWQDHKFYDFKEMTYSTKRIVAEGYEDPDNDDVIERDDYTLIERFDAQQANSFLET